MNVTYYCSHISFIINAMVAIDHINALKSSSEVESILLLTVNTTRFCNVIHNAFRNRSKQISCYSLLSRSGRIYVQFHKSVD